MIFQTRLKSGRVAKAALFGVVCAIGVAPIAEAASLRGSKTSLRKQNRVARDHNFSYLKNSAQVRKFVDNGYLVQVRSNSNFELAGVSFPYTRPQVDLFLNRLGSQYRSQCGERLVVTSLTRPKSRQPRNASPLSVHPTGMALDLRMPRNRRCRAWLEKTLLSLEKAGVLEATRERRPPHYHVALYPAQYVDYVTRITGKKPALRTGSKRSSSSNSSRASFYVVRKGDTLWDIAVENGTTVAKLKKRNGLKGNAIRPGQKLRLR